ncbi:MAG TPA: hypothetical protein EYG03_15980 [Planctomycetes bacterium]|nr:hypothetical protein [Planctomycetota bacterium]
MSRCLYGMFGIAVCLFPDAVSLPNGMADESVNEPPLKATKSSLVSLEDIERALELPCPEISIDGKAPLPDFLKIIGQHLSATAGHPVPFLEDHVELEREALTTVDEYEVRITKINSGTHTCFDLLQLLLEQAVDPAELAIVPRRGHVLVTTLAKASSDDMLETRMYDVSDLLPNHNETTISTDRKEPSSRPQGRKRKTRKAFDDNLVPTDSTGPTATTDSDEGATRTKDSKTDDASTKVFKQFGGTGYIWQHSGPAAVGPILSLAMMVQEQTPHGRWVSEGRSLNVYGHHLVIYQTYHVHRQINQLLSKLRDAIRKGGPPSIEQFPAIERGRGTDYFSVPDEDSLQPSSDKKATSQTGIGERSDRLTPLSQSNIEKTLQLPCPEVTIERESKLFDAVEVIADHLARVSSGHPVAFVQDYAELELEGLTSIEDVEAQPLRISAGTHTCRDVLELLFEQTTEPELTFIPRNGHVLITTLARAESGDFFKRRVYDLSDLVKPPINEHGARVKSKDDSGESSSGRQDVDDANNNISGFHDAGDWEFPGKYGWTICPEMETLLNIVYSQTAPPARWWNVDGEGGNMSVYGQYVVVIQTYNVHHNITQLLSDLRKAKRKVPLPPAVTSP